MLNVSKYVGSYGGNYVPNMNFIGIYYAPKTIEEMKALTVDTRILTEQEIKEYYANLKQVKEVDGIGWVEKKGTKFKFAEGTEDVYKKMGLDVMLDEYLARQQYEEVRWKIIVNAPYIHFVNGGLIEFGGHEFRIVGIINAFSTGTTPNKFKFLKNRPLEEMNAYAPKLIILE